jgi:hypothetical protein
MNAERKLLEIERLDIETKDCPFKDGTILGGYKVLLAPS